MNSYPDKAFFKAHPLEKISAATMMKRTVISCLAALSAVAAGVLFFYSFPEWLPPLYVLSVVLFAFTAGAIAGLYAAKKPFLKGLIAAAAYAAGLFSLTYLINNIMLHENQSLKATVILLCLNLVFFIVYYAVVSRGKKRRRALAACAFLLAALPVVSYLFAICVPFSGRVRSVVGSTDATPVTATERAHRFDTDRLLLGAYCLPKQDNYETLRAWLKEAGIDFYVGAWGETLTDEDLTWLAENGMGVFLPHSEEYSGVDSPAIWGVDLRDEPNAADFEGLAADVQTLYAEAADRFPLINLFPMYANGDQLGEHAGWPLTFSGARMDALNRDSVQYRMHLSDYIGTVDSDIISVDIYPLDVDQLTGKIATYGNWLRNLDILADACRATGRDLWVITQAAGTEADGGGKRWCDTIEDQRWQNYVTLAFGTKAIIYACYYTGWWDSASHMITDEGERTDTYYAVQRVNGEMATFAEAYGKYENHGAVLLNGAKAAGARLGLVAIDDAYKPAVETKAPLLCGCFTEKNGEGKAFVFTNMYEPQTGKEAAFTATFPGAKGVTVYRKGETTQVAGDTLELMLENREGVFVTVAY